jgi:AcrR family transcriptional regulator
MREVAAAVGAAPASLYRYVSSRTELLELMVDEVAAEYGSGQRVTGDPVADLLAQAHEALAVYRRHPWLLDIPSTGGLPGPNALAYMDRVLGILSATELSTQSKFEVIGLFTGMVRSFAQAEAEQQRAGQDTGDWIDSVARYLVLVASSGRYPHLAAVLAEPPSGTDLEPQQRLFDKAVTRILTGLLLPPDPPSARG